jgi:hypothetical protein
MILIGSRAICHWYSDFDRNPKDTDYWVLDPKRWPKTPGVEYLQCPPMIRFIDEHMDVLPPDLLCTLKASHLCWDINWSKHMFDLQFLLDKGCKINVDLFWKLNDYWNSYHGQNKRSDLKMSKDDFFNNAINYDTHQHDDLHKILNPVPVYTLILKEGKEVELCENKYNDLTRDQKLDLVREEVMVMAYERYAKLGYKIAYIRMLKKFIISHAPKFSLIFILENYKELLQQKFNYIKKIKDETTTNTSKHSERIAI